MTIGPEPIRRMDESSVRLGSEEVLERLIEGNLRRPARGGMELPGVPHQVKNIRPAGQAGVVFGDHPPAHHPLEPLEHLAERVALPGSDVVDLAGRPAFQQQRVRRHHVAHVEDVPHGVEVADVDRGGADPPAEPNPARPPGDPQPRITCAAGARPRLASGPGLAIAGIANRVSWPGPVWPNGRAMITRSPVRRRTSRAATSEPNLLAAYGEHGAIGSLSRRGAPVPKP